MIVLPSTALALAGASFDRRMTAAPSLWGAGRDKGEINLKFKTQNSTFPSCPNPTLGTPIHDHSRQNPSPVCPLLSPNTPAFQTSAKLRKPAQNPRGTIHFISPKRTLFPRQSTVAPAKNDSIHRHYFFIPHPFISL